MIWPQVSDRFVTASRQVKIVVVAILVMVVFFDLPYKIMFFLVIKQIILKIFIARFEYFSRG